MVPEYLIKVLENHNQGPGELGQGPGVLGSRTWKPTFSEQNCLPGPESFEEEKKEVAEALDYLFKK